MTSPFLIPVMIAIYLQDYHSPIYSADRVGRKGSLFRMHKLRSMVINADKSGVDSTSANDSRITPLGHFVRRFKLDELPQLWNVLCGTMSLVGPRPNVKRETDLYTTEERGILDAKPGITDLASIVFSDEGEILAGSADPDLDYNQKIRPWKSRLALFYVRNQGLILDIKIIALTVVTILDRPRALAGVQKLLQALDADPKLRAVAKRDDDLQPYPPPGATEVVTSRS